MGTAFHNSLSIQPYDADIRVSKVISEAKMNSGVARAQEASIGVSRQRKWDTKGHLDRRHFGGIEEGLLLR